MSTVAPTRVIVSGGKGLVFTWVLADGDVGEPIEIVDFADRSVQVVGTFGGATVAVQGSNDGVNYSVLTDPQGNDLNFTSSKIEMVTEITRNLRPAVVGGAGVSITVSMLLRLSV